MAGTAFGALGAALVLHGVPVSPGWGAVALAAGAALLTPGAAVMRALVLGTVSGGISALLGWADAAAIGVTAMAVHLALTALRRRRPVAAPPVLTPASDSVRDAYAGRAVLVTGAGGSIGSELARQVLDLRPARLVLLDLNEYALYRIEAALRPAADAAGIPIVAVLGSAGDARLLDRLLPAQGVEVVLHAAAYKHVPLVEANPAVALENNVLATETLLRASGRAGVARFVLISTDKAVRPAGVMGQTKWMAEHVVRDLGSRMPDLTTAIVRFGNVLGSSGSVLPLFRAQVRAGGPVTITDRRMERYFMTVPDAVDLVLEAGAMASGGETFLFDMGAPVRVEALARQVIAEAGLEVRGRWGLGGDIELRETGLRPGEKLREDLAACGRLQPTDHPRIRIAPETRLSEIEVAGLLRATRQAVEDGRGLDPALLSRADHATARAD
ncbi:MAG: polysaccharide biosynthesis protein [Pseudomonadota bacterium]